MKIYVKIEGITCDHCRSKITKELTKITNIQKVELNGLVAEIIYKDKIDKKNIVKVINDLGYHTDLNSITSNIKDFKSNITLKEFIIIAVAIISFFLLLNKLFGFNVFNMIPVINSNITYLMLFVTGLLTSIHCISMCGAINLLASSSSIKDYKKPILYNLGRLTSYTLIGGLVGLLGSVLRVNNYAQGIIIIMASILMFIMALNMLGIINFSIKFGNNKIINKLKTKGSFVLGLLNGLMPCGPLQAMQVYALSTGSFIYGAISMFLFCLGTIPLMLFVGFIANLLNNNARQVMNKVATVLILILSIAMLNRGLVSMGFDLTNTFKPNYDNYLKSTVKDNYQVIEFDLSYSGYQDIIVEKGIPVRLIINASEDTLTGCNNAIIINEYKIEKDLVVGKNIIEFTPNKTGTFLYTCWMGMLRNNIVVVDDLKGVDANK